MNARPLTAAAPVTGSEEAADTLARLFDAHHQRLYRLARRLTDSADDAADLVQEAFLRAARDPRRVPIGAPREEAWLVRVLVNIRRDQWRKARVRARAAALMDQQESARPSGQESALVSRALVWRALNTLHPRRRSVIVLHELEGHAVPAIATLLGISAVTVRWHLARGRRELSRWLRAELGETP